MPVCVQPADQYAVRIVRDGSDGAIITWSDNRAFLTTQLDVYAQRVDGTGDVQWSMDGVPISAASRWQYISVLVSDGAGGAILAWEDTRSSSASDVYAQRVDAAGTTQWISPAICARPGQQSSLEMIPTPFGGAIMAWADRRSGDDDIYAARVNGGGSVSVPLPGETLGHSLRMTPNPAEAVTTVTFSISTPQQLRAEIFDLAGRVMSRLDVGGVQSPGTHHLQWDGCDLSGRACPTGIYVVRVTSKAERLVSRLALVR